MKKLLLIANPKHFGAYLQNFLKYVFKIVKYKFHKNNFLRCSKTNFQDKPISLNSYVLKKVT